MISDSYNSVKWTQSFMVEICEMYLQEVVTLGVFFNDFKIPKSMGVLRPPCSYPFIWKQAGCTRWKIGYTESKLGKPKKLTKFAQIRTKCSVFKREQNAQIAHIRTMQTERPCLISRQSPPLIQRNLLT